MNEVLVNRLVKFAQEKVWLGEMTIPVDWDIKPQTKQTNTQSLLLFSLPLIMLDSCQVHKYVKRA